MQWSLFLLILMGQCSLSVCHLYEYHFIGEKKTWDEAQTYCRAHYTDLAKVFDMTDMKRLRDKTQSEAWIGLYNQTDVNGTWHWSLPGEEFNKSETKWANSEPNNRDPPENCVRMDDHKWKAVPCTDDDVDDHQPDAFICSNDTKQLNKKFHLIKNKMTWPRAQNYCRKHHTDLVSGLKQLKDEEFINETQQSDNYLWIGLFRDTWNWSDGSNFSFRNWDLELFEDGEVDKKCAMTVSNGKWSSDDCNETKPFFCYDGQCSLSVCHLYEYHFIEERKTWEEAQTYCRANYTDLAKVFDMTDMKRLRDKNQSEAWIGLYNQTDVNGAWHWSLPGEEFNKSETDWANTEPNNRVSPENCVRMDNHEWKDLPCTGDDHHEFICYDAKQFKNKFHLIENKMTWPEAQNYCREHQTDLVSGLKQLKDKEFINEMPQSDNNLWIGLFRDTWNWSDGSNISFRNWDLEFFENEKVDKKCAMTVSNGKWSSVDCNERKPFFCYDDEVILIKEKKTWKDALNYCRSNYRDLVSITNPRQQRRVRERAKMADNSPVWLGLRYTCTMDLWFWVNDNLVCYENWASEEKTQTHNCYTAAAMGINGEWFKEVDTETFNFICSLK